MRGEITYKVLKFIEDGIFMNLDFIEAVAVSGYGASYKKLEYEEGKIAKRRKSLINFLFLPGDEKSKVKRRVSKLIHRLKKDQLVSFDKKENRLYLMKRGRDYIGDFDKKKKQVGFLPGTRKYPAEKGKVLKIIAFDIPEKERSKREWLYFVLKNLGFEMLQKSVWIGQNKVPQEMIRDLSKLGLLNNVEIFEVLRKGSLE